MLFVKYHHKNDPHNSWNEFARPLIELSPKVTHFPDKTWNCQDLSPRDEPALAICHKLKANQHFEITFYKIGCICWQLRQHCNGKANTKSKSKVQIKKRHRTKTKKSHCCFRRDKKENALYCDSVSVTYTKLSKLMC